MKVCDYEGRRNVSGDRVRQARTARRYSQRALAAKVQTEGVILERTQSAELRTGPAWSRTMNCGRSQVCWE